MKVALVIVVLVIAATAIDSRAQPQDRLAAGRAAFLEVARVLQSPRCMNCHPAGDRPLQGDDSHVHAQNISRKSTAAGVPCSTCHQERNADAIAVAHGPPGAPRWGLPPAETPMVFQGKTPGALCEQLKDPERNGHRTIARIVEHVANDPLVGWAWEPGGKRTKPPLTRAQVVNALHTWADADGACPP